MRAGRSRAPGTGFAGHRILSSPALQWRRPQEEPQGCRPLFDWEVLISPISISSSRSDHTKQIRSKASASVGRGRTDFAACRCSRNRLNGASRSPKASIMTIFSPKEQGQMSRRLSARSKCWGKWSRAVSRNRLYIDRIDDASATAERWPDIAMPIYRCHRKGPRYLGSFLQELEGLIAVEPSCRSILAETARKPLPQSSEFRCQEIASSTHLLDRPFRPLGRASRRCS
jgi:hypothetical protein